MTNIPRKVILIIVSLSVSISVVQAAAPPSLADVMHNGSGSTGLRMLSLQNACVYASSTSATRNNFSLWDEIRRDYLPGIDPNSTQGYDTRNVNALRTSVLISRYGQRKFHDLLENRKALIDDVDFMCRIDASYTPQFTRAIRGYLLMAAGQHTEALQSLAEAGPAVSVPAQRRLNKAAGVGKLGFDAATGRAYLETRVRDHNDQHARQTLNEAIRWCRFGFDAVTGRAYLEGRARDHGDKDAQQKLNLAAKSAFNLGFDAATGRAYLETRIRDHADQHAQESLNEAARRGELGFDAVTGRAHLDARVRDHRDQHAQQMLNEAAQYGNFGFDNVTGRAYLETRAGGGDQHAQEKLHEAAVHGYLGFDNVTGRAYLEARIGHGDQHAQKYLNKMSGRAYLEARIQDHDDKDAQESLNWGAQWGSLGFTFKDTSVPWFFHFYNAIRGL